MADEKIGQVIYTTRDGEGAPSEVALEYTGEVIAQDTAVDELAQIVADLGGGAGGGTVASTIAWSKVTGKPTEFTPSQHTHNAGDIQGLDLSNKADVNHTHQINQVTGLANAIDAKADLAHNHTVNEVTGLQGALDTKANAGHTHTANEVTNLKEKVEEIVGEVKGEAVTWNNIAEKPNTYNPATHNHPTSEVNGLDDKLLEIDEKADVSHNHDGVYAELNHNHTGEYSEIAHNHDDVYATTQHTHEVTDINQFEDKVKEVVGDIVADGKVETLPWDKVTSKPEEFKPEAHTHTADEVEGLDEKLAGIDMSSKADKVHEHSIDNVTDLQTTLDGKADVNHNHDDVYATTDHTHNVDDIEGLQDKLDNIDVSDKADKVHTHTIENIDELQTALDGKAETNHTHNADDINELDTKVEALIDQKLEDKPLNTVAWNDITGKPSIYAPSTHKHAGTDITGTVSDAQSLAQKNKTTFNDTVLAMPSNSMQCFFIEQGSSAVANGWPANAVFGIIYKYGGTGYARGFAIAWPWNGNNDERLRDTVYIRSCHDTWSSWKTRYMSRS